MTGWRFWRQALSKELFDRRYGGPGGTVEKIAEEIASLAASSEKGRKKEIYREKFCGLLLERKLIPAGRIWSNARDSSTVKNFSNCFTIDVEDRLDRIFDALKEDALIGKAGGGVGFDISGLRPRGEPISKGGRSSGAVSFLKIFNESAKVIQTGGDRRSAHIALLRIDHPDIFEFISAKKGDENRELTQFNISVKIPDSFIAAAEAGADWDLVFEGKKFRTVKAEDLFNTLMEHAFRHNEPGVFFEDTVERYNNGWWALKMDRVNPCGEIVMPAYASCLLSHLFLPAYVKNPFTGKAEFDFAGFERDAGLSVRFLDDLIDRQEFPLKKIETTARDWRRVGLGLTGLADAFAMMGLCYGDRASKILSCRIGKSLRDASYSSSLELAGEKGPFPKCDRKKLSESGFLRKFPDSFRAVVKKSGLRNIGLNTIAPTGTVSLTVGGNCSSGIEPIYSLSFERVIRTGSGDETRKERVFNGAWLDYLDSRGLKDDRGVDVPGVFRRTVDSGTIDIRDEIDIQALFQRYIDHSISKTLTIPRGAALEDYKKIFFRAYRKGVKGFTSFNPAGSMSGLFSPAGRTGDEKRPGAERITPKRPAELACDVHEISVNGNSCLILVGVHEGQPYEIFAADNSERKISVKDWPRGSVRKNAAGRYDLVAKNGSEKILIEDLSGTVGANAYGTLARLISMSLRHRVPVQFIVDQLMKDAHFISFERAVARILEKYIPEGEPVLSNRTCPQCGGGRLIYSESCLKCADCHWSSCP